MISEEEKNQINEQLAIKFAVTQLLLNGQAAVMKDLDKQVADPQYRMYYRSLVMRALTFMDENNINVEK